METEETWGFIILAGCIIIIWFTIFEEKYDSWRIHSSSMDKSVKFVF